MEEVNGVDNRWKEEKKCFQKNIGSTESNTGQGSGNLDEGVIGVVSWVFTQEARYKVE